MKSLPVALTALAALSLPTPLWADGLVDNINGITIGTDGKVTRFNGVLIDAQGRVSRLYRGKEKRPEKLDFRLDGKGRTLVPGFVDAGTDIQALGLSLLTLDLSSAKSIADVQNAVGAKIRDNPGQRWILGSGWDWASWSQDRMPSAADLDAVSPSLPVWLISADGQTGWANSAAMRAAGISGEVKAPPGGRIEMAGGRPAGLFHDSAKALIERHAPPPLPKERDAALEKAQRLLLSRGITTITDMGTTIDAWQSYRRAGDRGALRLRILSYGRGVDHTLTIAGSSPSPWLYDDRLKAQGALFTLDGGLVSRGAWLKQPYADAPGQSGAPQLSSAQLRNQMTRMAMDGFQIMTIAQGDAAVSEYLGAVAELADTFKGDRRWRIAQSQMVDPAEMSGMATRGILLSAQPGMLAKAGQAITSRVGPARAANVGNWPALAASNMAFSFSAAGQSPFAAMAAASAAMPAPSAGVAPQAPAPGAGIGVAQALRAFSRAGAFAGFAEDRLGSMEPGKRADFILLDRDILSAQPSDVAATQVLESWVGGKRVYVKE